MAAPPPTNFKRESPFLHRVWKTVVEATKQVSSTNGEKTLIGDQPHRPVKRRRITNESLDSGVFNSTGSILNGPPLDDVERALRVEVLRIGRDDDGIREESSLPNGHTSGMRLESPSIKARCRLTICRFKPKVEMRVLHCDSQTCTVKVLRDPDDVCRSARIYLPQPFHIPVDKLFIQRDDDQGFTLADDYLIQTELESAGDLMWPPLDLLSGHDYRPSSSPLRQWVLSSRFRYKFTKGRTSTVVVLRKSTGDESDTNLRMDVDLRWTSFSTLGTAARPLDEFTPPADNMFQAQGALEPLTNGHINGRTDYLINGRGKEDNDIMDEDENAEGDALTPSRSLRMRDKPQNYNLKLLSDKARGKELKQRKKRKDAANNAEATLVTWLLPGNMRVPLLDWSCIRCFAKHLSFAQLELHVSAHPEFRFTSNRSPRGGCRIAISQHGQETPQALRKFDALDQASPEDGGSESEEEMSPQKGAPYPRTKPYSPRPIRTEPRDAKQTVPNIKQPIFDRLSKAQVEPGARIDEPQINSSWLQQKHRDIIKDYTDVHPDEKEYISEWDAFAFSHKVTFSPHLQGLYLKFLEDKSAWLVSSQNRMTEATKHLVYLKARDALNEDTVAKALEILRQARLQARHEQPHAAKSSLRSEVRKTASGCTICGQLVPGPTQLICANLECKSPLFHNECIRNKARMSVGKRNWRCNECYKQSAA